MAPTSSTARKASRSRARWWAVPVVAAVVVLGVWVTGALLTDDFRLAQVLTGLFLTAAGLAALAVAWRWRSLAVPVIATFVVVGGALGAYLVVASIRNVVVQETVVTADVSTPLVAEGEFVSVAHETSGTAALIEQDGRLVLTLTDLVTDPGPDLRVYVAPSVGGDAADAVDVGPLKGNRGTQQYVLPADLSAVDAGSVVIWCRAFSVSFGYAPLAAG